MLSRFSRVQLCATPETAAHQAPLSLEFSRQEHWSGLPFPSPMHESEKWKWSSSVVPDSATPWTEATRILHPWDFPGRSTGVGCHCLLHGCIYLCIYVSITSYWVYLAICVCICVVIYMCVYIHILLYICKIYILCVLCINTLVL